MKRPADTTFFHEAHPSKRMRQVHHSIKHKRALAHESANALQDESVAQSQLLRAITLALSAQGYAKVNPVALEEFRAEVEECKLKA